MSYTPMSELDRLIREEEFATQDPNVPHLQNAKLCGHPLRPYQPSVTRYCDACLRLPEVREAENERRLARMRDWAKAKRRQKNGGVLPQRGGASA